MRRVVRLSSRTPTAASSAASSRTIDGCETSIVSAAAVRLPASTMRTNVGHRPELVHARIIDYCIFCSNELNAAPSIPAQSAPTMRPVRGKPAAGESTRTPQEIHHVPRSRHRSADCHRRSRQHCSMRCRPSSASPPTSSACWPTHPRRSRASSACTARQAASPSTRPRRSASRSPWPKATAASTASPRTPPSAAMPACRMTRCC